MARVQTLRFSDEVEAALKAVLPSDDPLDSPDFDPVEYINNRFPTERSLDGLDSFIVEVRQKLRASESRLLDAVKVQATTASKAADDLKSAKSAVEELHHRVTDIKVKAEASEAMVSGICDSIRHLDTAKANLSKSIKTLSNLQLYIRNIHNLGAAIEAKEWSSVNSALRLAQDYRAKFKPFEETPKVKELSDKLSTYEREIEFRLCSVVISELLSDGRNDEVLREACLVVDALGPEVVARFRQKFIVQVMEPYNTLFRRGSEEASVERTERRFTFIRQILEKRRSLFLNVFPASWTVAQELCVEFCLKTNKEVGAQLREEVGTIEVAALVYILQRTIEFEKELTTRMRQLQIDIDDAQGVDDDLKLADKYKFTGLIVKCFDAYMDQYVQHEDDMLARTVEKSLQEDSVVEDLILQSSQDVFLFIQECSNRSTGFASDNTMADLARVWFKHLRNYAALLQQKVSSIPTTPEAQEHYCVIINSADYARSATEGVGVDLAKWAESELHTLTPEVDETIDSFAKLSNFANVQLTEGFCQRLQPHIAELQNYLAVNFSANGNSDSAHLDSSALDESPASKKLRREYAEIVRLAARNLHPHCFPYLLNKFAYTFIAKYWATVLYRPKSKLSDLSVSQLHIDCKALENALITIPNEVINAKSAPGAAQVASRASVLGAKALASQNDGPRIVLNTYVKSVKREINFLAMALKVLQLPAGDGFVQLYLQITPPEKRSLTDCTRLLDLKGVKADDTRQLIAILKRRAEVPQTTPRDAYYDAGQKGTSVLSGFFGRDDDKTPASPPTRTRPASEDPHGKDSESGVSAWSKLKGAAQLAFTKGGRPSKAPE